MQSITVSFKEQALIMDANITPGATKPAMVVLPGGGYVGHTGRECAPVANAFTKKGFQSFILHYSVKEDAKFPRLLQEVSAAIVHIRTNAEELFVDPSKIYLVGFSAGGHLAAAMASMWHYEQARPSPDMPEGLNRPTAVVLGYPLITSEPGVTHSCLRRAAGEMLPEKISVEKCVTEKSVPAFMWHCRPDRHLSEQNTLLLALAYAKAKIRYELRIYDEGSHGIAVADRTVSEKLPQNSRVARWVEDAVDWLKALEQEIIDWFALL